MLFLLLISFNFFSLISCYYFINSLNLFCSYKGNLFEYKETINYNNNKRIITYNSCSNHYNKCQESICSGNNNTKAQINDNYYEIPLYPFISTKKYDLKCKNITIGIALNGVSIKSMSYNQPICVIPEIGGQNISDNSCNLNGIGDGTLYCGDAIQSDGKTFDKCGGHADDFGVYHYHVAPICLIQQLTQKGPILPFNHSPQIAWALDGFPIYGHIGPLGIPILSCKNPLSDKTFCLDECNGLYYSLPDIDQYMYRYYVTGPISSGKCSKTIINAGICDRIDDPCCMNILPTIHDRPYTLGCFRGCLVDQENCHIDPNYVGFTDDFYPTISSYPTEVFIGIDDNDENNNNGSDNNSNNNGNMINITNSTSSQNNNNNNLQQFYTGYGSTITRYNQTTRSIGKIIANNYQDNTNNNNNKIEVKTEEYVQSGDEAYITGLILSDKRDDEENEYLLFTTQSAIYSMTTSGTDIVKIISGILSVDITGSLFGSDLSSITSLKIQDQNCSTIYYINSTNIACYQTSFQTNSIISTDDIQLTIQTTKLQGIYPQSETISRSRINRPVISNIELNYQSFQPYTVTINRNIPKNILNQIERVDRWIYWSDFSSKSIYRSKWNGQNIQLVLNQVENIYGLLLFYDQLNSQDILFYTDSIRAVIGRVNVPLIDNTQPINQPLSSIQSTSSSILLKDLEEPRSLAVDLNSRYLYLSTYYGILLQIPLSYSLESTLSYSNAPSSLSLPSIIKKIYQSTTKSRYDGITISTFSTGIWNIPIWKQVPIMVVDLVTNNLMFLSLDGFTSYSIDLYLEVQQNSVVWPRTVTTSSSSSSSPSSSSSSSSSSSNDILILYVGEIFGKIWKIQVNTTILYENHLSSQVSNSKLLSQSIIQNQLLIDYSKYPASIEIRNLIEKQKYLNERSELIYPDILN